MKYTDQNVQIDLQVGVMHGDGIQPVFLAIALKVFEIAVICVPQSKAQYMPFAVESDGTWHVGRGP